MTLAGSIKVRFAPSPTGYLHIGNARSALLNHLFALQAGGRFLLRIDDTDRERSREHFRDAIIEDLAWLGVVPDEMADQSKRKDRHDAVVERLKAAGRLYPAYETPDELDRRRKRQLARGQPPIYDRAALGMSDADRAALEAAGRRPHWRFRLDGRSVGWNDLVRGPQTVDTASLSDPVLVREDGTFLYTLPSVVDDIELGITHVIRGEDHVTNTGVQIEIFEALGGPVPTFGHHNLLASTSGEAMSKRLGSLSLRGFRHDGYEPMTIASLAVLVGSSEDLRAYPTLAALAEHVDLAHVSTSTAMFDPHDFETLNARLLHDMPWAEAEPRLRAVGAGFDDAVAGPAFWLAVRQNLRLFSDAKLWFEVVSGDIIPAVEAEDRAFLDAARDVLPAEPWDDTTWSTWTERVKAATGRKGKALFMPLRRALTGLDHGPELKALLPLIGLRKTSARLS
jgi:glutamyl-tRNA synthetase